MEARDADGRPVHVINTDLFCPWWVPFCFRQSRFQRFKEFDAIRSGAEQCHY